MANYVEAAEKLDELIGLVEAEKWWDPVSQRAIVTGIKVSADHLRHLSGITSKYGPKETVPNE